MQDLLLLNREHRGKRQTSYRKATKERTLVAIVLCVYQLLNTVNFMVIVDDS